MDVRLIRASIALFEGKRIEARRLLEAYRAEHGDAAAKLPIVNWLDAQTLMSRDERIAALKQLVAHASDDDPYRQMVEDYLKQEEHYEVLLKEQEEENQSERFNIRRWFSLP